MREWLADRRERYSVSLLYYIRVLRVPVGQMTLPALLTVRGVDGQSYSGRVRCDDEPWTLNWWLNGIDSYSLWDRTKTYFLQPCLKVPCFPPPDWLNLLRQKEVVPLSTTLCMQQ